MLSIHVISVILFSLSFHYYGKWKLRSSTAQETFLLWWKWSLLALIWEPLAAWTLEVWLMGLRNSM